MHTNKLSTNFLIDGISSDINKSLFKVSKRASKMMINKNVNKDETKTFRLH